MSHACCGEPEVRATPRRPAALGATEWLGFAATPTFALMALWTSLSNPSDMLCMSGQGASPLGGMAAMYALMSAFHAAPWLRWMAGR